MNGLPKITVVTPSYNQAQFLETTLKSVLEQDYACLEYIVIDGGSTDNSQEVIERYATKLHYWCSERDEGQSDAIAKGFELGSGDVLGWINSDDAFFPNALAMVGQYFSQHPEVSLVTAGTAYTNQAGMVTSCYERPRPLRWLAQRGITYFGQQAMFFRRSAYMEVGGIRRDFHYLMDTELLFRILASGAECGSFRGLCGFFRWHDQMKSIRRYGRKADERKIMEAEYGFGRPHWLLTPCRSLYRTWQTINGNYADSFLKTRALQGRTIDDIWGWSGVQQ